MHKNRDNQFHSLRAFLLTAEFLFPLRVYLEDTDAGGIVYNANYLKYMERARTEFFRTLGFDKPAFIADGLLLVVASAQLRFCLPARLDDNLDVSVSIQKLARTWVLLSQTVLRGDDCLCDAQIKIACVTSGTLKPSRLPGFVQQALTALLVN